jgi:hypothetical protein
MQITIAISVASLLLSVYALWVVQFRRGRLKMTQPTLLCLKRELPCTALPSPGTSYAPSTFLETKPISQ